MSTYVREKVLRIPVSKLNFDTITNHLLENHSVEDVEDDLFWCLEQDYPDLFDYAEIGKFQMSPTESPFIDYVLDYESDAEGSFGKIRFLYDSEKKKYLEKFKMLDPNVNMDDVHLVEFCWYNGCEAPDYYDDEEDDFYDEV